MYNVQWVHYESFIIYLYSINKLPYYSYISHNWLLRNLNNNCSFVMNPNSLQQLNEGIDKNGLDCIYTFTYGGTLLISILLSTWIYFIHYWTLFRERKRNRLKLFATTSSSAELNWVRLWKCFCCRCSGIRPMDLHSSV